MAKQGRLRVAGFVIAGAGLVLMLLGLSDGGWPLAARLPALTVEPVPPPVLTPVPADLPAVAPAAALDRAFASTSEAPEPAGGPAARSSLTNPGSAVPGELLVPTRTPLPERVGGIKTIPTRLSPAELTSVMPAGPPVRQTTATPGPQAPAAPTGGPTPELAAADLWRGHARWGIGVSGLPITSDGLAALRFGWYMDWWARADPPRPGGIEYMPMVLVSGGVITPAAPALAELAQAQPGRLWLVGNEPDVKWQDNVPAMTYAALYHEAYTVIKDADPTALVAIGGIAQPTPLRLRYLDEVLAAYQDLFGVPAPADAWHIHNYLLREERDGWGADIPPGMSDDRGAAYEIEDSGNTEAFRRQIVAFRRWMAERGYRGLPLLVTEFGVPMPADYGFPPSRVISFWQAAFDYFRTAVDPELGLPADGNRLVQAWCWFSLADTKFPTGNILDPETGELTPLGRAWADYVAVPVAGH